MISRKPGMKSPYQLKIKNENKRKVNKI